MKALVFDERLRVDDMSMPVPGPGEALVKVLAAGICNTDIEIKRGYMGFLGVLGHEFVGIVEQAIRVFLQRYGPMRISLCRPSAVPSTPRSFSS